MTDLSKKELKLILDCINIVQTLISTEYYENYTEEIIVVENDEYDIDNFSQKLFKIKAITKDNEKQKYRLIGDKIKLESDSYTIKYAFIPQDVDFSGVVDSHSGKLAILAFCYGVCSEYCLIKGLFDEADMWQKKFNNSIVKNFKKLGGIFIKSRRWI